jgi:hypothetical protein
MWPGFKRIGPVEQLIAAEDGRLPLLTPLVLSEGFVSSGPPEALVKRGA